MVRVPVVSGREIIGALGKIGYQSTRRRGSHIRLECKDRRPVTVPDYGIISRGLLKKILRDAELLTAEFSKLL